jgi:Bacterial PH domain
MSRRKRAQQRAQQKGLRRRSHSGLLRPDEPVLFVTRPPLVLTWPKYLFTLGLYGYWRRRQTTVLTNRRILVSSGIFKHTERAIPYSHVADAAFERRGLVGYADLILRGSRLPIRLGPIPPRDARRLTSVVLTEEQADGDLT